MIPFLIIESTILATWRRRSRIVRALGGGIFSFALLLVLVRPLSAGVLRIAIPSEVSIQADVILLRDLIPASAPESFRALAANVPLGAAPQLGSSRRISHESLLSALDAANLPLSSFVVPPYVSVRRNSRPVSREEVAAAIRSALAKNATASPVDLSTLLLDASVNVPDADANLELLDMRVDELLRRARFRLASKSSPSVLPFFATAPLTSDLLSRRFSGRSTSDLVPAATAPKGIDRPAPILVQPGTPARLHMHSANSDMHLIVNPLQRGRLGQTILVKMPGTRKTLDAQVVAPGELEAIF